MSISGWPLNYEWGHKNWDEDTDVALRGDLAGPGQEAGLAALRDWLGGMERATYLRDGRRIRAAWHGGGAFYLHEGALFIHSSGQDAFDAIAWYSDEAATALRDSGADVTLTWHELPHKRRDCLLDWLDD